MQVFPIESAADHARAMTLIEAAWDTDLQGADLAAFNALCALVDSWEARDVPFGRADPIEVIRSKLLELQWSQRELARRLVTSSGRVSDILNRKRQLTMNMVQKLARVLDIPPGVLVHDTRESEAAERWVRLPSDVTEMVSQAARFRRCSVDAFVRQALLEATAQIWRQTEATSGAISAVGNASTVMDGTSAQRSSATITLSSSDFPKLGRSA